MDKFMSYRQKVFEKIGLIIIFSDSLIPVKKEKMEESMKSIFKKLRKYRCIFVLKYLHHLYIKLTSNGA